MRHYEGAQLATEIFSPEVNQTLQQIQSDAVQSLTKTVTVNGTPRQVPYPFPSPVDWRDCWIYFLMLDRFNNPAGDRKSVV